MVADEGYVGCNLVMHVCQAGNAPTPILMDTGAPVPEWSVPADIPVRKEAAELACDLPKTAASGLSPQAAERVIPVFSRLARRLLIGADDYPSKRADAWNGRRKDRT